MSKFFMGIAIGAAVGAALASPKTKEMMCDMGRKVKDEVDLQMRKHRDKNKACNCETSEEFIDTNGAQVKKTSVKRQTPDKQVVKKTTSKRSTPKKQAQ
ncbi:MAG: hypothetical protein LBH24_05605 [Clostridiales bacterium]|jgi:hypothetical protein|nr:hypothetical protein [Clostridiales bacterium]